jgi:hypothetical protein
VPVEKEVAAVRVEPVEPAVPVETTKREEDKQPCASLAARERLQGPQDSEHLQPPLC